ncbi:MAG: hypothetical protein WC693_06775 [Patescibacteria group bacterium]|jgi:hypothetical protein
MTTEWRTYEEVATYLLGKFATDLGLAEVEGKQTLLGLGSQTEWEIDAKGVLEGRAGFAIIECRRYTTSKQSQEKVGSLAYRIIDTGAHGGIIVSPLGLQEGAQKVAKANQIVNIQLSYNSTPHEFVMEFLNKIFIGLKPLQIPIPEISVTCELKNPCVICGQLFTVIGDEQVCPECKKR